MSEDIHHDWRTEAAERKAQINALLDELNLVYEAKFVPQSQSRLKDEKRPTLNWEIQIGHQPRSPSLTPRWIVKMDYMQGIGHHPQAKDAPPNLTLYQKRTRDAAINHSAETGKLIKKDWGDGYLEDYKRRLPKPELIDVMYSLVMDSDVLNYTGFADWAENVGFDPDSIKAKAIYDQCIEHALRLRNNLGDAAFAKLQELFQDY